MSKLEERANASSSLALSLMCTVTLGFLSLVMYLNSDWIFDRGVVGAFIGIGILSMAAVPLGGFFALLGFSYMFLFASDEEIEAFNRFRPKLSPPETTKKEGSS